MNIFIVEDEIEEISGYLRQFENQGWKCERARTFSDAYRLLQTEKPIDLFIVDVMLPWGAAVDDETESLFDWKLAGVYLINAIRGRRNEEVQLLIQSSGLSKRLPPRYRTTPVVALTKIPEMVESKLGEIPGVAVVGKLVGLGIEMIPDLVHGLSGNKHTS